MSDLSFLLTLKDALTEWGWLALIFIGFTFIFAVFYFRHQSKQLSRAISSLYRINDEVHRDALDFFQASWPELQNVGVISLNATIIWFGEHKQIVKGNISQTAKQKQSLSVGVDDMRFEMVLSMDREAEQTDSVAQVVVQTFVQILEQDIILKQSEILTSQKRLERYQLFVQHEIKNIAQFIQLLAEQVKTVNTSEQKEKLIERIQQTLPVMAKRARKTVNQMQQPLSELFENQLIEVELLLSEIVRMYDLDVNIEGSAKTSLPRQILAEVFKNILGNYRDHEVSKGQIFIKISSYEENQINILIQSQQETDADFQVERMFEPFWSTSESGMGLGLFLARELLKQVDGHVHFFQDKEKSFTGFEINLPIELKAN